MPDPHRRLTTVRRLATIDLHALFATPPPEFVAARNELVKQLRRDKDRETATTVAAMRRPSWADWALNTTSVGQGEDVEAFAEAAEAVRDAQAAAIEGRAGPDVRASLRDLRDRTTALVRQANDALEARGRTDDTPELTARLADVAGNPGAVEQLRQGVLGSGDPGESDLFAGLSPPPRPRARAPAAPPASSKRPSRTAAAGEPKEPPPVTAAERRRRQRELDAAERRSATSRGTLARAEADVAAAERALAAAQARLQNAEEHAAAAAESVQRDEAERDAAAAALDEATSTS